MSEALQSDQRDSTVEAKVEVEVEAEKEVEMKVKGGGGRWGWRWGWYSRVAHEDPEADARVTETLKHFAN